MAPEQIHGRMKVKGYKTVCTATLYSFIKYDKASGGDLVTLTERFSKLNLIAHVKSKHAELVTTAIISMLKPYKN